jgi:phage gpG-like protein
MSFDFSDAEEKDKKLTHAIADMTPAMEKSQTIIEESIARRFGEEGDGRSAWKPLAASTIADRKRKGFPPGPILQRTGDLKDSIKGSHTRDSAEAGPSEDVEYAKYHLGEGRVKREFLALTESEADSIENAIFDHLEQSGG